MRIYQMTATFGKLEQQTLTLEPGLNVFTAPNEWGKSTWCAFLAAMFYGMDDKSRTGSSVLSDKAHYTPWSGKPMEGRIDLCWNDRDITIERKTKRRMPLGDFMAYETHTGNPVPELTAENCGQLLLGVEQSVFLRSAFIRQADLPLTFDETLFRRLKALADTGNENDIADHMADTLKNLATKCRHPNSGFIPQTENQRDALEAKLTELDSLDTQCKTLHVRIDAQKAMIQQLKNHRQALDYAAAQAHAKRMAQAQEAMEQAQTQLQTQEEACVPLPPKEEAETKISQLIRIRTVRSTLQTELESLPDAPQKPQAPAPFADMSIEEARKMLHEDTTAYVTAKHSGAAVLLVLMGALGLLAAGLLFFLHSYVFAGIAGVSSLIAFPWGLVEWILMTRKKRLLRKKYGGADQTRWSLPLANYENTLRAYTTEMQVYQKSHTELQNRMNALQDALEKLCGKQDLEETLAFYQHTVAAWDAYRTAAQKAEQTKAHFDTLKAAEKPVSKPEAPDELTCSRAETDRLLSECSAEQQQLENRLHRHQVHMSALGNRTELQKQLAQKDRQLAKLEKTYAALVIAQNTLTQAREEWRRRFAPKITKRAQHWMSVMTDGRYRSVTMDTQFDLRAAAGQEEVLRNILWRSEGTIDQLYLSLRLAVAEALLPQVPLILDDVLVRFDDQRTKAALSILREIGKDKQIILFTCHNLTASM